MFAGHTRPLAASKFVLSTLSPRSSQTGVALFYFRRVINLENVLAVFPGNTHNDGGLDIVRLYVGDLGFLARLVCVFLESATEIVYPAFVNQILLWSIIKK